ncbi:MAG: hypothetical protein V1879_03385, partial [Pseudomonadota bacterium]
MSAATVDIPEALQARWQQLACGFPRVATVFPDCMQEAQSVLSETGLDDYIENARFLGKMGRGAEPILIFLEEWPAVAKLLGEEVLSDVMEAVRRMTRSPNGKAIAPFLQSLPTAARRLYSPQAFREYIALVLDFMEQTTGSVHGIHQTFPSPGLPEFFKQLPVLLGQLALGGLKNWIDYGVRYYHDHPERQEEYFGLKSADAKAVLQRERHGTLLVDNERKLNLYLRGLWQDDDQLVPYSETFGAMRKPMPYFDALGIRLPDAYDDLTLPSPAYGRGAGGEGAQKSPLSNSLPLHGREGNRLPTGDIVISGLDRYRAALAHMAAHRRWSKPVVADNLSPFQRMAAECFEDIRVEQLAMLEYPGLRRIFAALHPVPIEDACDPDKQSAVRHRLAMVSRAMLEPECRYRNPDICKMVQTLRGVLAAGESSTQEMTDLAVTFIARTRRQADASPDVYFDNTEVSYRDDNRHMWMFIEEGDEEEAFDKPEQAP